MIRINLLPYRASRTKENVRDQLVIFLMVLVAVLGALFYVRFYLNNWIDELKTTIEKKEKEVAYYQKIADEVEELKKKLALLNQKLDVIEDLDVNRDLAFLLFDTLTHSVIDTKMWLTGFSVKEKVTTRVSKDKGKDTKPDKDKKKETVVEYNVTIDGIAFTNKTVADFMLVLEETQTPNETPFFKDISLVSSEEFEYKPGVKLMEFKVKCKQIPLKKPEKEKSKPKGKKKKK